MILSDFSEANVLKHCVFSLFLRDLLNAKESLEKIDPGSVDEAELKGKLPFSDEKMYHFCLFLHSFLNPLVFNPVAFIAFFVMFFRLKMCIGTNLL